MWHVEPGLLTNGSHRAHTCSSQYGSYSLLNTVDTPGSPNDGACGDTAAPLRSRAGCGHAPLEFGASARTRVT